MSEPLSHGLPQAQGGAVVVPFSQLFSKHGLLGFLIANALVVSILSPAFLKPENIANVLTQAGRSASSCSGRPSCCWSAASTCLSPQ